MLASPPDPDVQPPPQRKSGRVIKKPNLGVSECFTQPLMDLKNDLKEFRRQNGSEQVVKFDDIIFSGVPCPPVPVVCGCVAAPPCVHSFRVVMSDAMKAELETRGYTDIKMTCAGDLPLYLRALGQVETFAMFKDFELDGKAPTQDERLRVGSPERGRVSLIEHLECSGQVCTQSGTARPLRAGTDSSHRHDASC